MSAPFDPTYPFLGVLLVYMVYSQWAHLDSRYLLGAALLLLVITAVVDAVGATGDANVLAVYVFYLLGGGVLLLLIDHVREERARARAPPQKKKAAPPSPRAPAKKDPAPETTAPKAPAAPEPATPPSPVPEPGPAPGVPDQTNSSRTLSVPASPAF